MAYKLSIVIPCFNKWNFTKSCLNDLFNLPDDHEIVLVDNASTDETPEKIKDIKKSNFHYRRNKENLGFAQACNIGYTIAEAANVMFLNNDIRVKSDHFNWTDSIIQECEKGYLVGPTAGFVDPKKNFAFVYETNDAKKKINYMSGWCLAAHVNTWDKLRLDKPEEMRDRREVFSEEFGLAYFEDTDLGFRAAKLGIDFKLIGIPVTHFGKITSSQLNTNMLYTKAKQIFVNKWSNK